MILESAGIFWTPLFLHPTYEYVAPFAFKEDSDRLSFAIGLGSITGFDTNYSMSHILMRHLVQVLSSDPQAPNKALTQGVRSVDKLLRAQFPYDDVCAPGCTLLDGVIQDNQVWIAWLGTETAWHFRHASLIAATIPHTFGNALAAIGQPLHPNIAAMANIAHRALRSENELDISQIEMLESPWTLASGDTLIFASLDMIKHLNPQQVAQQLEGKDASRIAHALIAMLPEGENHYGAAAIVIRVL
jgi:hypothetical protein